MLQNGRSFHLVKSEGQARKERPVVVYVAEAKRHAPNAISISLSVAVSVAVSIASEFK